MSHSDQPKPTTWEHCPTCGSLTPTESIKHTGEWTNVDVEEIWEKGGSLAVRDAYNAVILEQQLTAAEPQLAYEREQVGILETELLATEKQLAAERERADKAAVRAEQAQIALAAELEKRRIDLEHILDLERQLAAFNCGRVEGKR